MLTPECQFSMSYGSAMLAARLYADAPEVAHKLHQRLHQALVVERSERCPVTPVIGAHAGPGLVGFAALPGAVLPVRLSILD